MAKASRPRVGLSCRARTEFVSFGTCRRALRRDGLAAPRGGEAEQQEDHSGAPEDERGHPAASADRARRAEQRDLDARPVQTATEVFGTKMAFPILVSPSAGHAMLHPDGELATSAGASAASNTPYIVSNASSIPFEKIAPAAKGPLWFQIYPKPVLDDNRDLLHFLERLMAEAPDATLDALIEFFR